MKTVASFFGIGYIRKGGGSVAAAACALLCFFLQPQGVNVAGQIIFNIVILFLGVWSGNAVEKDWGKDSYKVVIDEVSGMAVTLLFVPVKWQYVLIGFVLFRFFDILKPLYIKTMEKLPGGWGVMADDVLSGIYARILLQIIVSCWIVK
ncbi:MAG: phosphatidylglycerophosphatase A [Chitinophagaceae bacterium]|jgi:phosphatidylglycerophosphatase A|nr:phosphatidylglycerophosphatase A [Chitinophagaceae bacterium]